MDTARRHVYKLTTVAEPTRIQGLISLEVDTDHVFVYLVESAASNKGAQKQYLGVAGNLFAWACRLAFEQGYEGFVAFEAKTALLTHYQQSLGAQRMGRGLRMYLATKAATDLVTRYFPDYSTPQHALTMPTKLGHEPAGVDFVVESTPMTPEEKQAFSQLIAEQRQKNPRPTRQPTTQTSKQPATL